MLFNLKKNLQLICRLYSRILRPNLCPKLPDRFIILSFFQVPVQVTKICTRLKNANRTVEV